MGDLARLPRPDEDGSDSYDVPMGSLLRADDGRLMAPPRNAAMPPQSVVDLFTPNLSRPETYAPRSADLVPNAAGKVPTSDPLSTGAAADLANMAGYAIPFGGPTAAATKLALPLLAVGRRLVPAAEEAANAASIATGIRAYHSSPHDFQPEPGFPLGRFDFGPRTARTGEGAQVIAEGGYFAENPAVSGQGGQYWKQFRERFKGPEWEAARKLQQHGFDREEALQAIQGNIDQEMMFPQYDRARLKSLQQQADLLTSGKPVGPRTYEVDIKAHPDEMLDRDALLGQQSPHVQQAIEAIAGSNAVIGGRIAALDRLGMASGPNIYSAIGRGANPNMMAPESRALASNTLREAGIPGIRYLDQGSRSLPPQYDLSNPGQLAAYAHKLSPHNPLGAIDIVEGPVGEAARELIRSKAKLPALADTAHRSFNYVMFPGTEDKVHIMAKYGLAGAVPAMGSLADMSYREQ